MEDAEVHTHNQGQTDLRAAIILLIKRLDRVIEILEPTMIRSTINFQSVPVSNTNTDELDEY